MFKNRQVASSLSTFVHRMSLGIVLGSCVLVATGCGSTAPGEQAPDADVQSITEAVASDATTRETGVARWQVAVDQSKTTVRILGFDANDTSLAEAVSRWDDQGATLSIDGEGLRTDSQGRTLDNTLSASSVTLMKHMQADLAEVVRPVSSDAVAGGSEHVGQLSQAFSLRKAVDTAGCFICWAGTFGVSPDFCYKGGLCD